MLPPRQNVSIRDNAAAQPEGGTERGERTSLSLLLSLLSARHLAAASAWPARGCLLLSLPASARLSLSLSPAASKVELLLPGCCCCCCWPQRWRGCSQPAAAAGGGCCCCCCCWLSLPQRSSPAACWPPSACCLSQRSLPPGLRRKEASREAVSGGVGCCCRGGVEWRRWRLLPPACLQPQEKEAQAQPGGWPPSQLTGLVTACCCLTQPARAAAASMVAQQPACLHQ